MVVKITRSEAHSARLLNEGAVLRLLAHVDVAAGRTPLAWFSGFHAGRAVLGESLLDGEPYTIPPERGARTRHGQLDDALGWLTDLAEATSHAVPSVDMAAVLLTLLGRFEEVYSPRATEVAALREQFAALGTLSTTMPSVLQHGDPGIWNLLVDAEGRTMFLDWEAGEPDGMPLWDLLYLFRSHAIEAGRRAGVANRVEAAARDLVGDGPLAGVFAEAVAAYCRRVSLPPAAVPALTLGCWVHRALKEAARSAPGRLDEGLSVQLIRRMLATHPAPPALDK
jgi:aminoglycoside phosphotransferase (APT) family kinase protein